MGIFRAFRKYAKHNLKIAGVMVRERLAGVPNTGGIPLPPPKLRYRVHGAMDAASFLEVGSGCAQEIKKLTQKHGRAFDSFAHVLDFGCGCGRTLRFFKDHPATQHLYGTDIDPEAIQWCRHRLANLADWGVNQFEPPLRYAENTFDLIYGISVFTHIDENAQFRWLAELRRIAKPGGLLILTVHGEQYHRSLPAEAQAELNQRGILFRVGQTGRWKFDGLPDYYQTTYHTRPYVAREWSRYFKILEHIPAGMIGHQDAVILTKPAA
jgi:SAM-dependent methyltransferase